MAKDNGDLFQPIFTVSGQQQDIYHYSEGEFTSLKSLFDTDPVSTKNTYELNDKFSKTLQCYFYY
jgi:hypothetical protein